MSNRPTISHSLVSQIGILRPSIFNGRNSQTTVHRWLMRGKKIFIAELYTQPCGCRYLVYILLSPSPLNKYTSAEERLCVLHWAITHKDEWKYPIISDVGLESWVWRRRGGRRGSARRLVQGKAYLVGSFAAPASLPLAPGFARPEAHLCQEVT